jgi:hypothetical protein
MKGATWKDLLGLKEVRNFLTGSILVASAVIFATACVAYLFHNEFLERKYTVYALYEDGTGMSRGAKVLLNGVQVGSVQGVHLTSDARVVLALDLQLKYQSLIRRHSVAYFKRDRNMVSDRVLNIEKCDVRDTILAEGDTLRLESPQDIETALGSLANLTTQFRATLTRVDSLLHMVTDTQTTIGAVLVKDDLYRKTLRTVQSIDHAAVKGEQTIARLDHLTGVMSKSVPRLMEQADSLATRLNRTARSADTMGTLGVSLLRRGDTIASQVKVLTGNGEKLLDDGQSMLDATRKHWLVGRVVGGAKKPEEKKPPEDSTKK